MAVEARNSFVEAERADDREAHRWASDQPDVGGGGEDADGFSAASTRGDVGDVRVCGRGVVREREAVEDAAEGEAGDGRAQQVRDAGHHVKDAAEQDDRPPAPGVDQVAGDWTREQRRDRGARR